jgi:hypothetical protein
VLDQHDGVIRRQLPQKAATRSSMSLQSLLTLLLLMPDSPIACTRSSTRRVETPPT